MTLSELREKTQNACEHYEITRKDIARALAPHYKLHTVYKYLRAAYKGPVHPRFIQLTGVAIEKLTKERNPARRAAA